MYTHPQGINGITKYRVLVTGGTGMLGRAIDRYLKTFKMEEAIEYYFIGSRNDLCDKEECKAVFTRYKPTHVIHLAAHVGGMFENKSNNVEFYLLNATMNNNVLIECRKRNVHRVISCLSTCIFPDGIGELKESSLHCGAPHHTNMGYAYAKRMLHVLGTLWNQEREQIVHTSVTPCNLYGPMDKSTHVIPDLIRKFAGTQCEINESVCIKGTGKAQRQFLHVDDLAKVIIDQLWRPDPVEHVIVAPKEQYRIHDIVTFLSDQFQVPFVFENCSSNDGQISKYAVSTVFASIYPNFEFTNIWKGLAELCKVASNRSQL